jgi:hypothetical protein
MSTQYNSSFLIAIFETLSGDLLHVFEDSNGNRKTDVFNKKNGEFENINSEEFKKKYQYIEICPLLLRDLSNDKILKNIMFYPTKNDSKIKQSTDVSNNDNESIAGTEITECTSNESNSNTIVLSYVEKAKKFTQLKDLKKSTQKEDSIIDTLVKLALEFLTAQHKHSIRFDKEKNQICVTANKDIRELLVKLTESEIKLFESEINRKNCDKDIKFSIGPSTSNKKFTRILKAHHSLVEVSL